MTYQGRWSLSILTDELKFSWKYLEDMERIHEYWIYLLTMIFHFGTGGCDILGAMIQSKVDLINMTSFETLFEFFGLRFRSPE